MIAMYPGPRPPLIAGVVGIALLVLLATPCLAAEVLEDADVPMISRVPMYGQPEQPRPAPFKQADEDLVRGALEDCKGDHRAASNMFWILGESFMGEGKLNLALSRYNHSWLLDSSNYQPFWGFGRVLLRRLDLDGAIKYLEEARRLCGDSIPNPALLAELGTAYSRRAALRDRDHPGARALDVTRADESFEQALRVDPEYSNGWILWARCLVREGRYADAWDKIATVRRLGMDAPEPFLKELSDDMPEPGAKR